MTNQNVPALDAVVCRDPDFRCNEIGTVRTNGTQQHRTKVSIVENDVAMRPATRGANFIVRTSFEVAPLDSRSGAVPTNRTQVEIANAAPPESESKRHGNTIRKPSILK